MNSKRKARSEYLQKTDHAIGAGLGSYVLPCVFFSYLFFMVIPIDVYIDYGFSVKNVLSYVQVRFGQSIANGTCLGFFLAHVLAIYCAFKNKKDEPAYAELDNYKAWLFYYIFVVVFLSVGWVLFFFMLHQYPSDLFPDDKINNFQRYAFSGSSVFGIYYMGISWSSSTGLYMLVKGILKNLRLL